MKTYYLFLTTAVVMAGLSPFSWSQDEPAADDKKPETKESVASGPATGEWTWMQGRGRRGRMEASLNLKQEGSGLTGTYRGGFGGDTPISEGKFEDDSVSFKVVRQFGDRSFTMTYEGELEVDKITGKVTRPGRDGGENTSDWVAYRAPEIDPSGLWKWSVPGRGDGPGRDEWVKLKYGKGELSGVYKTGRGHVVIKDAALEGKTVMFRVERSFGDRVFSTKYNGELAEDGIKGKRIYRRRDEDRADDWVATRDIPKVDPVGTWTWSGRGRDGDETTNTLVLKKDGENITGSFKGAFGDAAIEEAKLKGDELSFKVKSETERGEFTSTFSGNIDGDELTGRISMGRGERTWAMPWAAQRKLPEGFAIGTWIWTSRRGRQGDEMVNKLLVTVEEGKLIGRMYRGEDTKDVRDIKIDGQTVSFKIDREFRDQSYTLNYRGTARGDVLLGGYQIGENEWDDNKWISNWEAKRATKENP